MRTITVTVSYEVTAPFEDGDVDDIEDLDGDTDSFEPVFEQIRAAITSACGGSYAMGHVDDENVRVEIEVD
jgi:hypothetical protein